MVHQQVERWQLRSGTWSRDLPCEAWQLCVTCEGTPVSPKLTAHDVGRMIAASRDASTGQWFPPDFKYSPASGALLEGPPHSAVSLPWVGARIRVRLPVHVRFSRVLAALPNPGVVV